MRCHCQPKFKTLGAKNQNPRCQKSKPLLPKTKTLSHLQEVGLAGVCPLHILVKVVQQVLTLSTTVKRAVQLTPHVEHGTVQLQVGVPAHTIGNTVAHTRLKKSQSKIAQGICCCASCDGSSHGAPHCTAP